MRTVHVALVQMRCEKGAVRENLDRMESYVREGADRGVDVMCFPEASITGYVNPRRRPEAVLRVEGPEVGRLLEMSRAYGVTIIAGLVEANPAGKPFITQVTARGGEVAGRYRKRTIPEDEAPLFSPGSEAKVVAMDGWSLGLAVCADIDNPRVFADCAHAGASVVFECAAPGLHGPQSTRDWAAGFRWWRSECREKLGRYAREHRIHVAVATQAGRTVDEDFPGGGYVFGPDGRCAAETPDWSEGVLYARLDVGTNYGPHGEDARGETG